MLRKLLFEAPSGILFHHFSIEFRLRNNESLFPHSVAGSLIFLRENQNYTCLYDSEKLGEDECCINITSALVKCAN